MSLGYKASIYEYDITLVLCSLLHLNSAQMIRNKYDRFELISFGAKFGG